jgi:leader peptidase (prepilin peptidase)/N-methyltransferase
MRPDVLDASLAFALGLAFGSFLNAFAYRVPISVDLLRRSFCPGCGAQIYWYQNLPLVSYLALRGRCSTCRQPIPWRYPLVELLGGVILVSSLWSWGLTVSAASTALFAYIMLALALIDVDHRILPNVITIPGAVVGFLLSFLDPRVAWYDSLVGAVAGAGLLYVVAFVYLKTRGREGMGMGDVKMMLLVGAFLGWQGALMTIFIGSFLGSLVGASFIVFSRKGWEYALPFGTFLAAAAVLVSYRGAEIFAWYWRTFGVTP